MPTMQEEAHETAEKAAVGWVILKDHIEPSDGNNPVIGLGEVIESDRGYLFREMKRGLTAEIVNDPIPFKLYDDDGELYYEGVIADAWLNGFEMFAFGPRDWAAPYAGCTELKYKENGEWRAL